MRIMVKVNGTDKWQKVEEKAFNKEKELQELLAENPDLIPVEMLGEERKPIRVWVREASLPGSGLTDLIGLDEDGNISIIETKLASNQEIKRKVIGQILEYAAYLWKKPYGDFDGIVRARRGRGLVELMEEAPEKEEDWSSGEFHKAVADNLNDGRFGLFIVVDEINEELRRIIDFVNSKDVGDLQLHALELKHFSTNQGEVVLPQIYGTAVERPRGPREVSGKPHFFKRAEELVSDARTLMLLRDLYDFLEGAHFDVKFGKKGGIDDRAIFRLSDPSSKDGFITVVRLKTDGTMKLGLGRLQREVGPDKALAVAHKLLKSINLPAIQRWAEEGYFVDGKNLKNVWGSAKRLTVILPDEQAVKQFKEGLAAFAATVPQ